MPAAAVPGVGVCAVTLDEREPDESEELGHVLGTIGVDADAVVERRVARDVDGVHVAAAVQEVQEGLEEENGVTAAVYREVRLLRHWWGLARVSLKPIVIVADDF